MVNKLKQTILHSIFKRYPNFFIDLVSTDVYKTEVLKKCLASESLATVDELNDVANFSSNMRDRWVRNSAESIPEGSKVLDAGAGQCQYKNLFSHTNYFSQDFAQYNGNDEGPLKESWEYNALDYVSDITDIPVSDNEFDVVLCTEVLEHVPDPIDALRELARVLKPSGKIFISAPLGSGVHQEPYHFYGGFSPYFYQKYFEQFGINLDKVEPLGGHFKMAGQELLRASRTLEQSNHLTEFEKIIMQDWLPYKLHNLDDTFFTEQFTVGYLVEGTKLAN